MTRKRWLAVIGPIVAAATVTACPQQGGQQQAGQEQAQEKALDSLRTYLRDTGEKSLYRWEKDVNRAICALKGQTKGVDATNALCPPAGGPVDGTPPPQYPK